MWAPILPGNQPIFLQSVHFPSLSNDYFTVFSVFSKLWYLLHPLLSFSLPPALFPSSPLSPFSQRKTLPPISICLYFKGERTSVSCPIYPPTCVCVQVLYLLLLLQVNCSPFSQGNPALHWLTPPPLTTLPRHAQDSLLSFPQCLSSLSDLSLLVSHPASKELRYSHSCPHNKKKNGIIWKSITLLRSIRELKSQSNCCPQNGETDQFLLKYNLKKMT